MSSYSCIATICYNSCIHYYYSLHFLLSFLMNELNRQLLSSLVRFFLSIDLNIWLRTSCWLNTIMLVHVQYKNLFSTNMTYLPLHSIGDIRRQQFFSILYHHGYSKISDRVICFSYKKYMMYNNTVFVNFDLKTQRIF